MPRAEKCLAKGCKKPELLRGLCRKHHNAAYYRVNVTKETTWRKLETAKDKDGNPAPLARPLKKTRRSKDKFVNAIKNVK
jgi:hypothetical protein